MKHPMLTLLVIHLCLISLVAIFITISDKIKAKRGKWRVPEAMLMTIGALGGAGAMYITMQLIRHKTKHIKFMAGLPIMILFHLLILAWLLYRAGIFVF